MQIESGRLSFYLQFVEDQARLHFLTGSRVALEGSMRERADVEVHRGCHVEVRPRLALVHSSQDRLWACVAAWVVRVWNPAVRLELGFHDEFEARMADAGYEAAMREDLGFYGGSCGVRVNEADPPPPSPPLDCIRNSDGRQGGKRAESIWACRI